MPLSQPFARAVFAAVVPTIGHDIVAALSSAELTAVGSTLFAADRLGCIGAQGRRPRPLLSRDEGRCLNRLWRCFCLHRGGFEVVTKPWARLWVPPF